MERKEFPDWKSFEEWKEEEELRTHTFFAQPNGRTCGTKKAKYTGDEGMY